MSKIILHQTYYLLTYFCVLKHFQNKILLQMCTGSKQGGGGGDAETTTGYSLVAYSNNRGAASPHDHKA